MNSAMKSVLIFLCTVSALVANAKATGQHYYNLDSRLVDSKYCVLIGTYNNKYSSSGKSRTAFLTSEDFCKSRTTGQLISYVKSWDLTVFISSDSLPLKELSPEVQTIYSKTGVSTVERKDVVSLVSQIRSEIDSFSSKNSK